MTGGSDKAMGAMLLLLLLAACGGEPSETASLTMRVVYADDAGIRPNLYVELVRIKGNVPASFHSLEREESSIPGEAVYRAEGLEPGKYRCSARWSDYLWPKDMEEELRAGSRPLPGKSADLDLKPGKEHLELDLRHGHGLYLAVEGLPASLGCFVRVDVDDALDNRYACCLDRLPEVTSEKGRGYFLPLFPGAKQRLRLSGLVPGWTPVREAKAASPPAWLTFDFPDLAFGSLEVELFYPTGEPVAGRVSVQREDFGLPFVDPDLCLDLRNKGRGRRGIDCLPEGRYRLFFFWDSRKSGGKGCEDLLDIEVRKDVYRRILFEPAQVTFQTSDLPRGACTVRIRDAEGTRVISKRAFNLPAPSPPFSLVSRPGRYLAELIAEKGARFASGPFWISGKENLTLAFHRMD